MQQRTFRIIERPAAAEYETASAQYIQLIPENISILQLLAGNAETITNLFRGLTAQQLARQYAPGKWTLKEVLLHLVDDERIYAYRALRFARDDQHRLHGFDQDAYIRSAEARERPLKNIISEYQAVRAATLCMYEGFPERALQRSGTTNEFRATVRALLYHIAGHEINHLRIVREKYLLL